MSRSIYATVLLVLLAGCQAQDLEKKNENLVAKTLKGDSSVIKLNKDVYKNYVSNSGRDYKLIIMFTALHPSRGCDMCVTFYNEFKTVASSWNHGNSGPNKVYFMLADYDSDSAIFQNFKLQGVPVVMYIGPHSKGKMSPQKMPLQSEDDLTASGLANWAGKILKTKVKVKYPFPWTKAITGISGVLFVAVILYLTRDKFSIKMASFRNFMACVILGITYYFLGGAMWNKIHRAPFSIRDRSGKETYIGRGRTEQVVAETYILMAIYGMMSLGFIILIEVPLAKGKKFVKIAIMFFGLALFVGFFQVMISTAVFKQSYLPHKSVLWWL